MATNIFGAPTAGGADFMKSFRKGPSGGGPTPDQQYAANVAEQAGQQQVGYARAAGLSPAQAALSAGQSAGSIFAQGMNDARQQSLQKYGIDKNYALGMSEQANQAAIAEAQRKNDYKMMRAEQNSKNQGNWLNAIGTGLSAGAALLSDEREKMDVKDGYGILQAVTARVKPKSFAYRADPGTERQGVMAQDLERTPLAYTVKDTPEGKVVDSAQLTGANTAMISELSRKVDSIGKFLRAGGK